MQAPSVPYHYRAPVAEDGGKLFSLVRKTPELDLNSPYYYILFGHAFSATSLVALAEEEIAGFVTGFIPQATPDTLFIWQVCVASAHRGCRLGSRMLHELMNRQPPAILRVEATVTPDNTASRNMFITLADTLHASWECHEVLFSAPHFGGTEHAPEIRFRIGPLPRA